MAKMYLTVGYGSNYPCIAVRELETGDDRNIEKYVLDLFAEMSDDSTELSRLVKTDLLRHFDPKRCTVRGLSGDPDKRSCTEDEYFRGWIRGDCIYEVHGKLGMSRIQNLVDTETDLHLYSLMPCIG
jgi:hypothetical protein